MSKEPIGKNSIKPRANLGMTQWRIQSVLVPKATFSKTEAIKYVKEHFHYLKIDSKPPNFYRFRQVDPVKGSQYITKKLDNGVELVIEKSGVKGVRPPPERAAGGSLPIGTIYKVVKNGYSIAKRNNIDFKDIGDFTLEYSTQEVQVYKSESRKQIIVNYTGTYSLIDWLNVLAYYLRIYRFTYRYKRAKDEFLKILTKYPNYQITIVAHSQSAAISREFLKEYSDVFEIININPASYTGYQPLRSEYTIYSSRDIPASYSKKTPEDLRIEAESINPIKEHNSDILLRLNLETEFGRK
jgi:hypothetical protein